MATRRGAASQPRPCTLAALAVALTLLAAAPATSAAPAPADYAQQVNSICKQSEKQALRALNKLGGGGRIAIGDESGPEAEKALNRLFKQLGRISYRLHRISARRINRIALVSPPSGDEARVANWVAIQRTVQRLTKRNLPRYINYTRLFILVLPDTFRIAFGDPTPPDKQTRRRIKKLGHVFNKMDRVDRWILDETSRASILAAGLGASRCGGDTSPEQGGAARAIRDSSALALRLVRQAQASGS